eukprot:6179040-Pleurochrysis_carterae.AAC.3
MVSPPSLHRAPNPRIIAFLRLRGAPRANSSLYPGVSGLRTLVTSTKGEAGRLAFSLTKRSVLVVFPFAADEHGRRYALSLPPCWRHARDYNGAATAEPADDPARSTQPTLAITPAVDGCSTPPSPPPPRPGRPSPRQGRRV